MKQTSLSQFKPTWCSDICITRLSEDQLATIDFANFLEAGKLAMEFIMINRTGHLKPEMHLVLYGTDDCQNPVAKTTALAELLAAQGIDCYICSNEILLRLHAAFELNYSLYTFKSKSVVSRRCSINYFEQVLQLIVDSYIVFSLLFTAGEEEGCQLSGVCFSYDDWMNSLIACQFSETWEKCPLAVLPVEDLDDYQALRLYTHERILADDAKVLDNFVINNILTL